MADNAADNANPFKVGDLVRLISGSPKLAVAKVVGDIVTCVWLSYPDNHPHSFDYPFALLRTYIPQTQIRQSQANNRESTDWLEPDFMQDRSDALAVFDPPPLTQKPASQTRRFGFADPDQETPF